MPTMPKDAQDLFDNLVPEGLKQFPDKARELNAIYCFKISGDGGGEWTVDCTANPPSCVKGDSGKAFKGDFSIDGESLSQMVLKQALKKIEGCVISLSN